MSSGQPSHAWAEGQPPEAWLGLLDDVQATITELSSVLERLRVRAESLLEQGRAWEAVPSEPVGPPPASADDEAARQEVRVAVDRARAELAGSALSVSAGASAEEVSALGQLPLTQSETERADEEAVPGEVHARADFGGNFWGARAVRSGEHTPPSEPLPEPRAINEAAVRDQVRRAVELARTELQTGPEAAEEGRDDSKPVFRLPDALPVDTAPLPLIVIDDPSGRVELASVYDTLARLGCADDANLMNYTPHSVTIGLGFKKMPEREEIVAAIEAAFGRPCAVSPEGGRLTVRMLSLAA